MVPKFHGCIAPIVTPVDEHENVDEKGFRALLDWCVAGGLHGILVAGTNGETMALTQKERLRAIRIAVDQIGGRIPVMAGCMDTSTRRVVENIKAAQDVGVTCAAVTPVFYDRHTSQDETVRHFERILQETDIPELVIYNIPPFVGIKLTPQTIIRERGWRTFMPDSFRQALPSTTTDSRSRMCASSSGSMRDSSASG